MINAEELMTMSEVRFLSYLLGLGLLPYQIVLYEYWKRGISPVPDQSILARSDVEYIKVDLNKKGE